MNCNHCKRCVTGCQQFCACCGLCQECGQPAKAAPTVNPFPHVQPAPFVTPYVPYVPSRTAPPWNQQWVPVPPMEFTCKGASTRDIAETGRYIATNTAGIQ